MGCKTSQFTLGVGLEEAQAGLASGPTNINWDLGQAGPSQTAASTSECQDEVGHARLGYSIHQHT